MSSNSSIEGFWPNIVLVCQERLTLYQQQFGKDYRNSHTSIIYTQRHPFTICMSGVVCNLSTHANYNMTICVLKPLVWDHCAVLKHTRLQLRWNLCSPLARTKIHLRLWLYRWRISLHFLFSALPDIFFSGSLLKSHLSSWVLCIC